MHRFHVDSPSFPTLGALLLGASLFASACGPAPTTCTAGQTACAGVCVNTQTDSNNCGTCGTACTNGQMCSAGACSLTCASGLTVCKAGTAAAYCGDLQSDASNCGACGNVCATGDTCSGGTCKPPCVPPTCCPAGETSCPAVGGTPAYCAALTTDPNNCGSCGTACGTSAVCFQSACLTAPAVPQVVNFNGPVLANPKIVPIFFSNDNDPSSSLTDMTNFYNGIGNSNYWAALSEYGVNRPASVFVVNLTEAAASQVDDANPAGGGPSPLQTWLLSKISMNQVPAPDANTFYVINYPTGTTISDGQSTSCKSYGGYHADVMSGTTDVAYAVVPRCSFIGTGVNTDLDVLTPTASHELVEGCSDPYGGSAAWAQVDNNDLFWDEGNSGSEIGDMCQNEQVAYQVFPDFPFLVQRFWSNQAVSAGHDPCVPAYTGGIYFRAVPIVNNAISYNYYGSNVTSNGVQIAVGKSLTIPLQLYSDDASAGNWVIQAVDFNQAYQKGTALLSFSFTTTNIGQSGEVMGLKITVLAAGGGSDGEPTNTELYALQATQGSGANQIEHTWWGIVGN